MPSKRLGQALTRFIAVSLVLEIYVMSATPAFAAWGDGSPTVSNPDIFVGNAPKSQISDSSGAYTLSIPIDAAPGRNGLQPNLSLEYSSQNTEDGIVGYGWSLSIPYIERINKRGTQDLYSSSATFLSSIDGELASETSATTTSTSSTPPSFADSLPVTNRQGSGTSDSFSYSVPAGGSNKLLVVLIAIAGDKSASLTASQNGVSLTCQHIGNGTRAAHDVCYLANPSTGTFSMSWTGSSPYQYDIFTLKDAAQTSPIDASAINQLTTSGSSLTTNITTATNYTLLLDNVIGTGGAITHSYGSGQATYFVGSSSDILGQNTSSYKVASSSGATSMARNFSPNDNNDDLVVIAVKPVGATSAGSTSSLYRAKVDSGSFTSYSYSNNAWTAYDKKGTRYLYGSSDTGRQFDIYSGTSTNTYRWYLEEIRDTNDNYIKYTYLRDRNILYPYQIIYTGNGVSDGPLSISFSTSTRPDPRISYRMGFQASTSARVSRIDVAVDNSLVRQYSLSYTAGNNGYRSLLSGVYERGFDESGNATIMPGTTFGYISNPTSFFSTSGTANGQAWQFADTNGNGVNDLNRFIAGAGTNDADIYLDDGTYISTAHPPGYWSSSGNPPVPLESGYRYMDVNADGKADLVRGWRNDVAGNDPTETAVHINTYTLSNGIGWTSTTTSGTIPYFGYKPSSNLVFTAGILGDFNGDRMPDFVTSLPGYISAASYLGNGLTWNSTTTDFVKVNDFPTSAPSNSNDQFVDLNADGLDDWVYSDSSNTYVRLNTGRGWSSSTDSRWTIATSTLYDDPGSTAYRDRGMRFADINGDGLVDFVRSYQITHDSPCNDPSYGEYGDANYVYLNTGSGWNATTTLGPGNIYQANNFVNGTCQWTGPTIHEIRNSNGNGQMKQDVINRVSLPRGAQVNVMYSLSSASGKNPSLPYSLLVASEIGINDGLGTIATTSYAYEGGKLYTSDGPRENKFAGFAISTSTAPDSVTVSAFSQGDGASGVGERTDNYALINRPYKREVRDTSNNLLKRIFYRWDTVAHGSSTMALLTSELEQLFGTGNSHNDKATEYQYASTTGDLLTKIEYGEVSGTASGTYTDIGSDKRTTTFAYIASSSINLSLPKEQTLFENSGATSTYTKTFYDGLSFGSIGKGNPTREERLISGTRYASTTKTYNSYGLPTQITDTLGNATTFTYESKNVYPATTTNPLSQATGFLYNYSNGKVKLSIDPNGRLQTTTFDGIGRPTETKQSDTSSASTLVTASTITYTDSSTTPASILRKDYMTSTTSVDVYQYFDGLGRLIQERRQSASSTTFAVSDKLYNTSGEVSWASLPYYTTGSSYASTSLGVGTTFTYDSLKRVLTAEDANGKTSHTYVGWTKRTTDPNGNLKDYVQDAFGNLAAVVERLSSTIGTTTYAYDAQNNLATTTDALGNVRAFTYDGLGRRTSSQDLHATGDSTFGSWSYTYDDSGNPLSQTDPKSQVVNRTYDALNRMLTEDYTGASGIEITNTYDSCTNGVGSLCTASSTVAKIVNTYDILGRVAAATTTISGSSYGMTYTYDRKGNTTLVGYPNSRYVSNFYNSFGLPSRVQAAAAGGSFADIASTIGQAAIGKTSYIEFGNGVETSYTYDPSKMYRLTRILSTLAGVGGEGLPEAGEISIAEETADPVAITPRGEQELQSPAAADFVPEVLGTSTAAATEILSEALTTSTPSETGIEAESLTPPPAVELKVSTDIQLAAEMVVASSTSSQVATSTDRIYQSPLEEAMDGMSTKQRATFKGKEIAKLGPIERTARTDHEIEVQAIEPIEGGVQAFVRAWNADGAIGFGPDGSVEIERFRIFNPPILVDDEAGPIIRRWIGIDGTVKERRLREDTQEALLSILDEAIAVKAERFSASNIIPGKVGRTTSVFYPEAGSSGTSADGGVVWEVDNSSWSTLHDSTDGHFAARESLNPDNAVYMVFGTNSGTFRTFERSFYTFNTAAIPDNDTVSAATMSLYGESLVANNTPSPDPAFSLTIVGSTPAANNDFVVGDYDQVGTTQYSNTTTAISSMSTSAYTNWAFNVSGLAAISKTGVSKFAARDTAYDIPNTAPTYGGTLKDRGMSVFFADETGTTKDPKLVVEHAAGIDPVPSGGSLQDISYTYDAAGNITKISDYSAATSSKILNLSYDGLNRLVSATTTAASSTPFYQSISYDILGNISTNSLQPGTTTPVSTTAPSRIDSPTSQQFAAASLTNTMSYTVPSTDSNRCLIVMPNRFGSSAIPTSVTWNGTSMTKIVSNAGQQQLSGNVWYLANPDTGAHDIVATYAASESERVISAFTLKNCAQSNALDASYASTGGSGTSASVSTTTATAGDYILTWIGTGSTPTSFVAGGSQSGFISNDNANGKRRVSEETQTVAASYTGSYSWTNSGGYDLYVGAIKGATTAATSSGDTYTYGGTGYANPHAVTQIANGTATTTYAYDNNGNLTSAVSAATTTTYAWDYLNRLIGSRTTGDSATTTYGYDYLGQRVLQTTASTTYIYPNKYFSIASSTGTGARYSTTTSYVWSGDTLLAYIEQALDGGVATGTAQTYYVHPDHLGSTNVITNGSGISVVSTKDYYPFGSVRVNSGATSLARGYISQFEDGNSLDYLQNRYYQSDRGQFLSEDQTFLALGDTNKLQQLSKQSQTQFLADPQQMNSYSYARNNPIINKDPQGNQFCEAACADLVVYPIAASYAPAIWTAIGAAATYITADIAMRTNGGMRAEPFDYNRLVRLPGTPDPLNPWDGWKPGDPKDWRTWVSIGTGIIGAATEIYQQAQNLPANNNPSLPPGNWKPLPPIVIQGSTTYYRTSNGLLSATPQQTGSGTTYNSNGTVSSDGKTPVGRDSKGNSSYCLGVCGR